MKVILKHPTLGQKSFSLQHWETIQKWPNQGGWTRVADAPKEATVKHAARPKASKPKVDEPAEADEIIEA